MHMRTATMFASLLVGIAGHATVVLAEDADSVAITPVTVTGCGSQSLTFSGTATYSESTQHLVGTLDGTVLFENHSEPATWTAGATVTAVGSHTFVATIYDRTGDGEHETVRAQATGTFTVPSCTPTPTPSPTPTSADTVSTASTPSADADCCPGRDEAVARRKITKKLVGRVKGVTMIVGVPGKLRWINETFRGVYGHTPTLPEWQYWSHRLLTDKPQYDALYGAMQWHKHRGHTIGK